MPVCAAPARRVDDPTDQDRYQHETDEPDDQRPVHGREHYTPQAREPAMPTRANAATRRRVARPVRWRTGTPTRPGAGGPAGTRIAAGSAAADRRDGWVDTWRTVPRRIPRRGGSGGKSSPHSSPSCPACVRPSPGPPRETLDLVGTIKPNLSPLLQRRFPEIARSSHLAKYLQTAGYFATARKPDAISVAFGNGWRPA